MPPSLRSRGPICHYCNRWSSSKNRGARRFRCENCLAENFLDEHGEVVDVPPEEASSPQQIARPFAKPLPTDQIVSAATPFCSTCIKNQHLLTETLANYLPAPDDPKYELYEASYPEFRQKLEERYPPVCARCEPGAKRQIEQAIYSAKSDHLRRVMERSKGRRVISTWGWRSLVVTLGAVLFWASIVGQVAWNSTSILGNQSSFRQLDTAVASYLGVCAAQASIDRKTGFACAVASAPIGFLAIAAGFLSSWWNPKWQHRLEGREGRLVGLQRYYQVNMTVLLARLGFWLWTNGLTTFSSPEVRHDVASKIAHALAMAMTVALHLYNLTRVKVDATPLVSWQNSPGPLLSQRQYSPTRSATTPQPPFVSHVSRVGTRNAQSFPVASLAAEPRRHMWQAPTPPPDQDPDAMEWEPSRNFLPKPTLPKVNANPVPSPFYGALPAAPTNRLLQPQGQRHFPQKEAIGLPPGFFDKKECFKGGSESTSLPPMAQPKFFSQGDREADTGLESIFDAVFSLRDVPALENLARQPNGSAEQQTQAQNIFELPHRASYEPWYSKIKLNVKHTAKLIIFATGLVVWYVAVNLQLDVPHMKLVVICIAGLVSLSSALLECKGAAPMLDVSNLIWSGVMGCGGAFLVSRQWDRGDREANAIHDRTGMIFLFICSCWELPRILDSMSSRSSGNQVRPYVQPDPLQEMQVNRPPVSETGVRAQGIQPSRASDGRSDFSDPKLTPSIQRPEQKPFYRTRSDSADSATSQSSVSTTVTATSAGWKTPTSRSQPVSGASNQSPGFSLRSLALTDAASTPRRREHNGSGTMNRRRI